MSFFRSRNIRFTQVTNGSICFLKFPEGHPWLTGKKWKALGGCTSGLGYNHPETMSHGYQPISCIYGQRWGPLHNHGFQKLNVIALPNCDSFSGLWILAILWQVALVAWSKPKKFQEFVRLWVVCASGSAFCGWPWSFWFFASQCDKIIIYLMQLHTIKLHISNKCLQPCRRRALGIVVKESNHVQIRSIYVFEMSSMICLDWLRKNYVARSSPDYCLP